MSYSEPLAKSVDANAVPLGRHLREVAEYARAIAEAYHMHWRKILGDEWAERVRQAAVLAALTHDLGKAATGFQRDLQTGKSYWGFRHEVLSTALLLTAANPNDETMMLAIAAVLTHHRDLGDAQLCNDSGLVSLPMRDIVQEAIERFRAKAEEMRPYWTWLRQFCREQPELQHLRLPDTLDNLSPPAEFLDQLKQLLQDQILLSNPQTTALLLTRGSVMAADHAVSAGLMEFKAFLPTPVLPPLRPFQERLSAYEGDAFLEAPTGSGKTMAALLWALRNRQHGERVFYLLPYQASIEAMADTLEEKLGKENVAVLHARALDYAFREYFERGGEYKVAYSQARLEADVNRHAHKPLKIATPYQLLKWLFGIPRFEIGICEMVGGLFIFDEIHAYDAHLVALIVEMVRVLKQLGGRCLFMSATFPPFLKVLLQDALDAPTAEFTLGDGDSDVWTRRFLSQARHRLRWHNASIKDLLPDIVQAAETGQRVLVVANRVAQAQELYHELQKRLPDVHLLHSRFTHQDRVSREKMIIRALQGKHDIGVRVLVATQVVEVSLDVSFDTIFSEVAPVDDLLQRFGRVNRYSEHPDGIEVHIATQFDLERLRWVYDLERVAATLEKAPADGTPLTVEVAAQWVRQVYQEGWTEKERKQFEQAQTAFQFVLRALRPLHHSHEGKEEFYGLFHNVEVLPRQLFEGYNMRMRNKHYLLATQLLVPIPLGTFKRLERDEKLTLLKDGVWMVDVSYDPDLGLLPKGVDVDVAIL